jgi:hypothetical protein
VAAGDSVAKFGAEYQPGVKALPALSVFADAEIGEDDWNRVFVGLRFYFGGETKSLIRRHREDDPSGMLDMFRRFLYQGIRREGDPPQSFTASRPPIAPGPPPSPPPGPPPPPCWVAREVYGVDSPDWRIFRFWLLNRAPEWFRNLYIRYGERFADWISGKTWLKKLIRIWMDTRLRRIVT